MGNCKSGDAVDDSPWWAGTPRRLSVKPRKIDFNMEELLSAEEIVRREMSKEEKKTRTNLTSLVKSEEKKSKILAAQNSFHNSPPRSSSAISKRKSVDDLPRTMVPKLVLSQNPRLERESKRRSAVEEAETILRLQEAVEREKRRVKAAEQLLEEEQRRAQALAEKELNEEIERVYQQEQIKKKQARAAEKRQAVLEKEARILEEEAKRRSAKETAKIAAKAAAAERERVEREKERDARLKQRSGKSLREAASDVISPDHEVLLSPALALERDQTTYAPAVGKAEPSSVVLTFDKSTGRMVWIPPVQ